MKNRRGENPYQKGKSGKWPKSNSEGHLKPYLAGASVKP
jgi:hypothetical protein